MDKKKDIPNDKVLKTKDYQFKTKYEYVGIKGKEKLDGYSRDTSLHKLFGPFNQCEMSNSLLPSTIDIKK